MDGKAGLRIAYSNQKLCLNVVPKQKQKMLKKMLLVVINLTDTRLECEGKKWISFIREKSATKILK